MAYNAAMADRFVSRGGEKLQAALKAFALDVAGWVCADFGANVGGFTDCLLQNGAAKVFAVDTGYGDLAWKLRKDPRVIVMERTNALHAACREPVDLVVADMAWTPQARFLPAAAAWLKGGGRIVSLLKPHYEQEKLTGRKPHKPLTAQESAAVWAAVRAQLEAAGFEIRGMIPSPIQGKGGNTEYLIHVAPNGPVAMSHFPFPISD